MWALRFHTCPRCSPHLSIAAEIIIRDIGNPTALRFGVMWQVVMRSARAKSSSNMKVDRQGATLVLAGEDIVSMTVKRFPLQQNGAQRPMGLGTDAAIGSRTAGGTGMRSLKKV